MRPLHAALVLLFLGACGDPVVDGSFLGEPLAVLRGRTVGDAGTSAIARPYVGILWINFGSDEVRVIQSMAPIEGGPLSRDFTLTVWDAPPPGAINVHCDGTRFGMGLALAVDDLDGDGAVSIDLDTGALAPPDLVFGIAPRHVIVYVEEVGSGSCMGIPTGIDPSSAGRAFVSPFDACDDAWPTRSTDEPLEVVLFSPTSLLPDEGEACDEPPPG